MKNLTVKQILEVTNGELIQGNENFICQNFSKDTRSIQKGDTYIAIKGANFDGNLFWKDAFEKGAECAIISEFTEDRETFPDKTIIKVNDTLEALYQIARFKRSLYNIPVIAVTGSVGKTSTKDIIASVISQKYKTLKTMGNNNNNIGLPFTILKLQEEEAMVLEMGMNHFGEISLLTSIAKPNICVLTNIGTSHIGNLGSRENILKAKLEILEGSQNPTVILNNDNDLLHNWQEKDQTISHKMTYGIQQKSDIEAKEIQLFENGSEFTCHFGQERFEVKVPVGGEHFILNALCAIGIGKILDIPTQSIQKGIESFELTKNRMDILTLKNGVKIINDAYNASLESMQASLKYLLECQGMRKIAVLGDMLELGEYTQKLHEQVGEAVYRNHIDLLLCQGENAKYIAEQAKIMGMEAEKVQYFVKKEELVQQLKREMQKGDIILLKASNGMRFFDMVEQL